MNDEVIILPYGKNCTMLVASDGTRMILSSDYVEAYQGPKSDLFHLRNARVLSNYPEHPDPGFSPPTSPLEEASMAVARRAAADYRARQERTAVAKAAASQPRPNRRHPLRGQILLWAAELMSGNPKATENSVSEEICEKLAETEEYPPAVGTVRRWLREEKTERQRLLNASIS